MNKEENELILAQDKAQDKAQDTAQDEIVNILMELDEEKQETKKNIDYWESEATDYINKGDIMSACWCRILANNLRKDIGE